MKATYKNNFDELDRLFQDVDLFSKKYGLDVETTYSIKLCIEEVFTNVVRYGFEDAQEHIVHLSLTLSEGNIEIEIRDDGKAFNPLTEVPPPSLDEELANRKIGGLGIFFIKEMMDELEYQRTADHCNKLKMIKRLSDVSCSHS
jgi:serine/threonine-protein kinase RsbW